MTELTLRIRDLEEYETETSSLVQQGYWRATKTNWCEFWYKGDIMIVLDILF